MAKPKSVKEYLAAAPLAMRAALQKVRKTIKAAAPGATERIGYGIIAFSIGGKSLLLLLGYWKTHCSIYGVRAKALREEPQGHDQVSARCAAAPLPDALVKKLVKARLAELTSKAAASPGRSSTR